MLSDHLSRKSPGYLLLPLTACDSQNLLGCHIVAFFCLFEANVAASIAEDTCFFCGFGNNKQKGSMFMLNNKKGYPKNTIKSTTKSLIVHDSNVV